MGKKSFGDSVKAFRKKHRITQMELAAKLKTTQPHLSRIEANLGLPSMQLAQKIAAVAKKYGVELSL